MGWAAGAAGGCGTACCCLGGSPGLAGWAAGDGAGVTAPFSSGGAAPWRGASAGTACLLGSVAGAVGRVLANFGPGAAGACRAVGRAKVGMSATAVLAVAMFVAGAGVAGAGVAAGLAALGWAALGWASGFTAATDAVGAGGAATGATGAAAILSGATCKAERITGCERTKAVAGTTVAKRWFISAACCWFWQAAGSCRSARCQRSFRTWSWTCAGRLMR